VIYLKALILAGGEGRRLRPLTNDKPKPLIELGGKPIIEWQIEWMKKYGIGSFVISAGYMKDKLIEYLGNGSKLAVDIEFVIEDEPLGTGGAIKNCEGPLSSEQNFVVANGDIITNFNLGSLINLHKDAATISLTPLKSTYGIVDTDGNKVVGFREKPLIKDHWLNAGIYVMSKSIFEYLPKKGSLEQETFPVLASKGLLNAMKFNDVYWISVDTFKEVENTSSDLSNGFVYK
jgi:mannose-1-phosphate guanylyltransferase